MVLINTAFAIGVYIDAENIYKYSNRQTFLVGRGVWALATILGGVFVAGIYWLIHHSNLKPNSISEKKESYD